MRKSIAFALCVAVLSSGFWGMPAVRADGGEIINPIFRYYDAGQGKVNDLALESERLVKAGFFAPVVKDGGIGDPLTAGYYSTNNLSDWFHLFGDTNSYQYNYLYAVPDTLKNATYIRLNRSWRGTRTDTENNLNAIPEQTRVLNFQLDRSAIVYYIYPGSDPDTAEQNAPWLIEEGWTADGTVKLVESNGTYSLNENPQPSDKTIFKKVYRVKDGETATVNIGGYNQSYWVPMVFVDWPEDITQLASLSNVMFKQYDGEQVNMVEVPGSNIITTGFTSPVYKTGEGAILDPAETGYYSVQNMTSWFSMFSDTNSSQYNYFYDLPAYMRDSAYIRMPKAWREPRTNANTPNAMNAQSEVLTFDIDMTANIYYVCPTEYVSLIPDYANWLLEEGWTLCEERVPIVESTNAAGENPQLKNCLLFRKKFLADSRQTENVKIGGFYQNWFVPLVFIDWVNEETTKNISVSVIGSGKVDKPGNQDVEKGGTFTIQAIPDEGYTVEYIKFNGVELLYNASFTCTTPPVEQDGVLEVKFKEAEPVPQVVTFPETFHYLDEETGLPCGITFATALDYTGRTLVEYGIVFSETDPAPTLESGGIRLQGIVSRNEKGQFGMKLIGEGLQIGKTYYTTPYAIYTTDSGGKEIIYGDSTSFIPEGQVFVSE